MAERTEFYLVRVGHPDSLHKITCGELSIGRDLHAFITCTSAFVSRRHLILSRRLRSSEVYVKDLKTANGTFVNGKRISPEKNYPLAENDVITLGSQNDIPSTELYQFKLIKKIVKVSDNLENNNVIVIDDDDDDDVMEVDINVSETILSDSTVENKTNSGISKVADAGCSILLDSKDKNEGDSVVENKTNSGISDISDGDFSILSDSLSKNEGDSGISKEFDSKNGSTLDTRVDNTSKDCSTSETRVDNILKTGSISDTKGNAKNSSTSDRRVDNTSKKGSISDTRVDNISKDCSASDTRVDNTSTSGNTTHTSSRVCSITDSGVRISVDIQFTHNTAAKVDDISKETCKKLGVNVIDNVFDEMEQMFLSQPNIEEQIGLATSPPPQCSSNRLQPNTKCDDEETSSKPTSRNSMSSTPVVLLEQVDLLHVRESLKRRISRTSIECGTERSKYLRLESCEGDSHSSSSHSSSSNENTKDNSKSEKRKPSEIKRKDSSPSISKDTVNKPKTKYKENRLKSSVYKVSNKSASENKTDTEKEKYSITKGAVTINKSVSNKGKEAPVIKEPRSSKKVSKDETKSRNESNTVVVDKCASILKPKTKSVSERKDERKDATKAKSTEKLSTNKEEKKSKDERSSKIKEPSKSKDEKSKSKVESKTKEKEETKSKVKDNVKEGSTSVSSKSTRHERCHSSSSSKSSYDSKGDKEKSAQSTKSKSKVAEKNKTESRSKDDSKLMKETVKSSAKTPKKVDNIVTSSSHKTSKKEDTPKDKINSVSSTTLSRERHRSDSSLSRSSKDDNDDAKSKERTKSASSSKPTPTIIKKKSDSSVISKDISNRAKTIHETTPKISKISAVTVSSTSSKSVENKQAVSSTSSKLVENKQVSSSNSLEMPSTSQVQTRSSNRTKHTSSTPIAELVTGMAAQSKRSNCIHSKDPRQVTPASSSLCKTDSDPKLGRIPRRESMSRINSNDEIKVRRQSIFEDMYDSPKVTPIIPPRRKSVSFVLENNSDKIPQRRSSVVGIKSILKPTKPTNTLDIPNWLMCFLKIVIRWNPKWIEEHFKMKKDKSDFTFPPIFHDKKPTPPIFTYLFKDFEQYAITLTNLIIMEVWQLVYSTCIEKKILASNDVITMAICGEPVLPCDGSCITKISCKCVTTPEITDLLTKKILSNGTVLLVKFPDLSKGEYFGLFNECDSKSFRYGSKETIVSIYTRLDFKSKWHQKINDGIEVTFKIIASVRNEMMLVKAIHGVEYSPLCKIIITPKETYFTTFKSVIPLQWRHELNASQKKSVQQCICAISSRIPSIQMIHGPPGTGKSRVIAALVLEYYQRNVKNRSNRGKVLICSPTNVAVDEIIKRLLEAKKEHKAPKLFEMVRVGRFESMQPWAQDISSTTLSQKFLHTPEMQAQIEILNQQIEKYKSKVNVEGPQGAYCKMKMNTYQKKLDELYNAGGDGSANLHKEELEVIKRADVIVSTLQSCSTAKMKSLNNKIAFCVIDEAAKAVEPEVLIPLGLGVECLVMVGDNQQLTGFTHSQYAKQKGFNESLFSRIMHSMTSWKNSSILTLDTQYRMAAEIAYFPNQAFYEGTLKNGLKYPPLPRLLPEYRVVHIPGNDCSQGESGANFNEAKVVSRLAVAVQHVCVTEKTNFTMCVLTPYSGHRDAILTQLKILSCTNIDVYTVDSFQGQERDVVIISLARSVGTGFLVDPGRMSVLLTRARRSCIVCCNPDFVKGQPLWESFLVDASNRKMERKLPKNFSRGIFQNTPKDLETLLCYIM